MSGHNAPSPAPRSASTGPNGPLPTPTGAPSVNGIPRGEMQNAPAVAVAASGQTPVASNGNVVSQQNLNQIVIDYLAKKGYTKTEATFRAESSNQEVPKEAEIKTNAPAGCPQYFQYYSRLKAWTDDALDTYKPEVQRLLWPFFVYAYLDMVNKLYAREAGIFFKKFAPDFKDEHDYDLRGLEYVTMPEHTESKIAKIYTDNKYRLSLSSSAFTFFMSFLESLPEVGFKLLISIVQSHLDLRQVERGADDRYSFAAVIQRSIDGNDMPMEDEGIPGHRPGNAISSTDPTVGNNLATLKLGKLPMEKDLEEDVRAELSEIDLRAPPAPGKDSLVATHEAVNIKQEDDDEGPSRSEIPFPPSRARDVTMEVQKIRENRDRLKIESRTGGVGPGLSVVMYTFHNTKDSVNCIDFSGDGKYVACGFNDSYIRVWTLDGSAIENPPDPHGSPVNSVRLIGHSGPVYTVAFQPSSSKYADDAASAQPQWMLSCSADGHIRLWNLDVWQTMVIYRGHVGPVWSVSWGPYGHYFASAGHDRLGRIWQTDQIKQIRMLAGHDDDVDVVAWHPNSSYVFTASSDKTVRMWALTNGNPVRMFTGHTSMITALACSRNGKLLASADDVGTILLWDLGPGRLLKKMRGHGKGGIWSLSWNFESTVLVSGGADCTVRSWDVTGPGKEAAPDGPSKPGEGSNPANPQASVAAAGGGGGGAGAGGVTKKRGKGPVVTNDQISAFPTKSSPVYVARFTPQNLIMAGGLYLPELSAGGPGNKASS